VGTGISLHVGVNLTDPFKLGAGRFQTLFGCDLAAGAMADIAAVRGFGSIATLVDRSATRDAVVEWLRAAAATCQAGDLALVTFAGHGTLVRHLDEEARRSSHAIVLHDGTLADDELMRLLDGFRARVRVVLVADCCFGGAITTASTVSGADVKADVLVLTATSEGSRAPGAPAPGEIPPFTRALYEAWQARHGDFPGGYLDLWALVGGTSRLNRRLVTDPRFLGEQPFSI